MLIQPYVFFDGPCEEAIAFYREALDAQLLAQMRFSDSPEPGAACPGQDAPPPQDKIMHAMVQIGETQVMMSDGFAAGKPEFRGISLSLSVADDAEAKRRFDALAVGGQVVQALEPTFFSSSFGMVNDRFGVSWMVVGPMLQPPG